MMLLVPSDPVRPNRADAHFAPEAAAARAAGITVALVDHDAVAVDADRAVARVPAGADAVYRGWMLSSGEYTAFAAALARRGVTLRTSAEQYRQAHELPGWYASLRDVTPRSVWTTGFSRNAFDRARAELGSGPAVLRDYTKSMKHHWDEAAFIPSLDDAEGTWQVAARFLELRDDSAAGGFVLRRFEQLTKTEVRTWWFDGVCRLVTAHPDTPDDVAGAPDLTGISPLVAQLGLPFVTVDLALRDDEVWRVVELGDGQVSDRPSSTPPEALIGLLA